jgi:hypothetical protein
MQVSVFSLISVLYKEILAYEYVTIMSFSNKCWSNAQIFLELGIYHGTTDHPTFYIFLISYD